MNFVINGISGTDKLAAVDFLIIILKFGVIVEIKFLVNTGCSLVGNFEGNYAA
jgi:hypothetical protein